MVVARLHEIKTHLSPLTPGAVYQTQFDKVSFLGGIVL
jgi:hypothetical protein